MRRLANVILGLAVLAGAATGCSKFTYEKAYLLEVGNIKMINIDAPTKEQIVKVKATSENNIPFSAYLVLENHAGEVEKDLANYKKPDKTSVLDSKEKITEATLEAKVPAKSAYAVILAGSTKDTTVHVKIEGN
jgi:hypothetical protein